jgi:hypothetical protein
VSHWLAFHINRYLLDGQHTDDARNEQLSSIGSKMSVLNFWVVTLHMHKQSQRAQNFHHPGRGGGGGGDSIGVVVLKL